MNKPERRMELANFICRFGDNAVLIDHLDDIIIPAFTDKAMHRSYDDTKYFFHQVSILDLGSDRHGDSVIAIVGRFIKDTIMVREQIFKENVGLVANQKKMKTAPSSIFALMLNSHRLLYVKETPDGPGLSAFRATILNFIKEKRRKLIRSEFENHNEKRKQHPEMERMTLGEISARIPTPTLEIIALATEESVKDFVAKYDLLKTLEIKLIDPNNENDDNSFFDELRESKNALNSKTTLIKHTNTKEGLNKDEVVSEINKIGGAGNHLVKVSGTDESGDTITATNDKFSVKVDIGKLSSVVSTQAKKMYLAFQGLAANQIIKIERTKDSVKRKLEALSSKTSKN